MTVNILKFQLWCVQCDKDFSQEELVEDSDDGTTELFCPECGSNHFGFYRSE